MGLFTFNIHVHADLNKLSKDIKSLNQTAKEIMASVKQLKVELDEMRQALTDERAQILAKITGLEESNARLEQLIEDGGTQEERQAIFDEINAATEEIKGIVPDSTEPVEPVDPTEPVEPGPGEDEGDGGEPQDETQPQEGDVSSGINEADADDDISTGRGNTNSTLRPGGQRIIK